MNPSEPAGENEPTFLSHLIELRERLLKAIATVLIVLVALMPFANRLYTWLAKPLLSRLPAGGQMIAIDVASPFFTPLKLAFFCCHVSEHAGHSFSSLGLRFAGFVQTRKTSRRANSAFQRGPVLFRLRVCVFSGAADGVWLSRRHYA